MNYFEELKKALILAIHEKKNNRLGRDDCKNTTCTCQSS